MKFVSTLFLVFFALNGFAQTGAMSGVVKTADGQPAQYVNIELKGTRRISAAGKNGTYLIINIEPGTCTLSATFARP